MLAHLKSDNTNILHSTETRRRQGFLLAALLLSEQELNNSAKGRESSSDKCVHLLIIKICIFTHKENIQRIWELWTERVAASTKSFHIIVFWSDFLKLLLRPTPQCSVSQHSLQIAPTSPMQLTQCTQLIHHTKLKKQMTQRRSFKKNQPALEGWPRAPAAP